LGGKKYLTFAATYLHKKFMAPPILKLEESLKNKCLSKKCHFINFKIMGAIKDANIKL